MVIWKVVDKARSASGDGKIQISMEDFEKWLMDFDKDKDGRICRRELHAAIRSSGSWFNSRKSHRGMNEADVNGNGFIDKDEIKNLVEFAEKHMGFKIR